MKAEFSFEEPIANSSKLALPTIGTRFSSNFCVTVALYGETKFSNIVLDVVVFEPIKFILSFKASGTPAKSGKSSPFATFSSTFFAVSNAVSSVKELKAPNFSSKALILSREALVSSTAETSLFLMASNCAIPLFFNNSCISSPYQYIHYTKNRDDKKYGNLLQNVTIKSKFLKFLQKMPSYIL